MTHAVVRAPWICPHPRGTPHGEFGHSYAGQIAARNVLIVP
jgi:hypothetical protein